MKRSCSIAMVLWLLIPQVFASGKILQIEGYKVMYSSTALKEKDFQGSNFFIRNVENPYVKDLNVRIFNHIMKAPSERPDCGKVDSELKQILKKTKGELIITTNDFMKDGRVWYAQYDKGKKDFVTWTLYMQIDESAYNAYEANIRYYEKCLQNIDQCYQIINNCSEPTIRKSRTVQVPYTYQERVWNPGNEAVSGPAGAGIQSTGGYGHYETITRTVYRNEIQYYDVANPSYNPSKVNEAERSLTYWEKEKTSTEDKFKYVPCFLGVSPDLVRW